MSAGVPSNAPQGLEHVDLRLLARRGEERDRCLAAADRELEAIVDELERVAGVGGRVNMSLASRLTGVSKPTLYARLNARRSTENTNHRRTAA